MKETLVVVPCFNEAERLDKTAFESFAENNASIRFLFVDDGSTDATRSLLEDIAASKPDAFETLCLEQNRGKAEAVRAGMLRGFETKADYVAYWDADLATPLDAILSFRDFLDARSDVDIVLGARVRRLGADIERGSMRHYLGRVFATFASLILGLGVYDTQCGAKMFRSTGEIEDLFAEPFLSSWVFDVELLARFVAERELVRKGSAA